MAGEKQRAGKRRISVKKMNGETEIYNPEKLRKSLVRVGADDETINRILEKVDRILHDGIETKKLFDFVHKELNKTRPAAGLKYNLKSAMVRMRIHGGFVFEKFAGRVLEKQGYKIQMNPVIQGEYVTHEIDVFAQKGSEKLMVEVKHHMDSGERVPIQTALYVYARFLEVKKKFTKPMLITNAKFSEQVVYYSKGVGIRLMGWKYPYQDSLEDNIARYNLYPITILEMPENEIRKYLEKNILTIQELREQKGISEDIRRKIDAVLRNEGEK
ncbi:MAG: restriction endonuclease [archaeon]